jgi:AcrR family transcriptional regulator
MGELKDARAVLLLNLRGRHCREVDERILDAARKLFVERGFEGASIDEIAEAARAGKSDLRCASRRFSLERRDQQ